MRGAFLAVLVTCVVAASVVFYQKLWSPFGHREAFMRGMDSCLQSYASHHNGWFPNADTSYSALAQLYPNYCDTAIELAGLSGNIEQVSNALRSGQSISNLTSWNYVPGLREDDDPKLAILWESKIGLTASGKLSFHRTRAVLLLNRGITNVSAVGWAAFLKSQEALQQLTLAKRAVLTNSPTPSRDPN